MEEDIMKINWKVRLKNPVTWATLIPAAAGFVYMVLGLFGVVPSISEETIVQVGGMIVSALTTLGVLVDPTTKGIGDGALGITYTEPQ